MKWTDNTLLDSHGMYKHGEQTGRRSICYINQGLNSKGFYTLIYSLALRTLWHSSFNLHKSTFTDWKLNLIPLTSQTNDYHIYSVSTHKMISTCTYKALDVCTTTVNNPRDETWWKTITWVTWVYIISIKPN